MIQPLSFSISKHQLAKLLPTTIAYLPKPTMIANQYNFFCVLSTCFLLSTSSSPARTFTNQSGKKIEAEIVKVSGEQVSIKLANGKTFTLAINSLSKADQEYIRSYSKQPGSATSPTGKLDERVKAGASIKLDFPDLTPDRKDQAAAVNLRIPDKYDASKPVPLIVWLGGGDGGNSAGACASLVDQSEFLMVGLPYPKGANNPGQDNMVGEFGDIWDYHKTMLDEIAKLIPNIDPNLRIVAGFSNGGHAIDGMMKEKEFRQFFKAYVLIDGGMDTGKYSGMSGTYAYIAWGENSPNASSSQSVAKSAKRGRMSTESHQMDGVGHAFPVEEKALVKKWIADVVVPGLSGKDKK